MTDDEFLRALENCRLPQSEFNHFAHVRAGIQVVHGALNLALNAIR